MNAPPTPASKTRRHIWIEDDDWDWVGEKFGRTIGVSKAIQLMLKKYRRAVEAKVAARAARPSLGEDLGDLP